MKSLKWHQVHAWRLSQHSLSPRLKQPDLVKAVTSTGGIQAQVMSAAELALFTRVEGLSPQDVKSALWQDRTLVKTWAMRGTLHVFSASELPRYVAARSWHDETRIWSNYFAYYGITPAQQEAFLAAVPHVLGNEPLTRQQLAAAIARHTGVPQLRDLILSSGWGSPLKPSAFRGDLCFGPSQGQNVTFVNPRAWIGTWPSIEPELALQEIARLYLRAYGSIEEELEEVEVEGWRAFALRATLEPMQSLEPSDTLHLLPLFDAYTIGMPRDIEPMLSKAYKNHVFRPQGWISAVVLVNGSIQGVWQYKTRGLQTVVKVHLFSSPTALIRKKY